MEHIFEDVVAYYLSRNGSTLVVPQYSIRDDQGGELTCRDFVTVDLPAKRVEVVEVKTGPRQRLRDLIADVNGRESRWYVPLRRQLNRLRFPIDHEWSFGCRVFVRKDAVESVKGGITDPAGVTIEALEDIVFSWRWSWPKAGE